MGKRRKPRDKDFTSRFHAGEYDADSVERVERLDGRDKKLRQAKIDATAQLRADDEAADIDQLPIGTVRQVFSLYLEVVLDGASVLCTVRKTLNKRRDTTAVVGDRVRVRRTQRRSEAGPEEGVIERVEARTTLLTRSDSFKAITQHPIVANATRMMIVVAVALPRPKWGLVDRMLVAARAGGLDPVVCLNKIDLGHENPDALSEAREVLNHYRTLGIRAEETCATQSGSEGILRDILNDQVTVLAGHSGVGKSSLVRLIEPKLDIRVGEVSDVNEKGKHTTTSARIYDLPDLRAQIIDTPGVKLFGLWNLTTDHLDDLFPDVVEGSAPSWRVESYHKIAESLGG